MQHPSGSGDAADFDSEGASARPGGQAEGGTDAHAGDPASAAQSDPAARDARREMRERGFGDHKGGDIS